MKVLISGGSGLIGTTLTLDLVKDGHEVLILSRNPEGVKGLPEGASAAAWDGKTAKGWGHHINDVDAVINLAGASIAGESLFNMRWTKARKVLIRESRLKAGKAITEAIRMAEKKPKVLVQASAIGYYGPLGDEEVKEDHPPGNDFIANVCQEWEDATKEVEELGVRRVVIRTGLVFSNGGGLFPLLKLPFSLFVGGPIGSGSQYLSWIHMDDQTEAIRFLIENDRTSGVYNLTTPNPVTNREFAKTLGKMIGRPSFFPVPEFVLRFALGEVSTLALDGQRVIPSRLNQVGFKFKFPDLELALQDLLV